MQKDGPMERARKIPEKTEKIKLDKPGPDMYNNKAFGRLAQLVEHPLDVRKVAGSSPTSSTIHP